MHLVGEVVPPGSLFLCRIVLVLRSVVLDVGFLWLWFNPIQFGPVQFYSIVHQLPWVGLLVKLCVLCGSKLFFASSFWWRAGAVFGCCLDAIWWETC